jgi:hypothetical protein
MYGFLPVSQSLAVRFDPRSVCHFRLSGSRLCWKLSDLAPSVSVFGYSVRGIPAEYSIQGGPFLRLKTFQKIAL